MKSENKTNPIDEVFDFLLQKEAKTCSWAKKKTKEEEDNKRDNKTKT